MTKLLINKHKDQNKERIVTCPSCGSVFSMTNNDIEEDRDGKYVICPACLEFINERILPIEPLNCFECWQKDPDMAELCDECKADTMCVAFRQWYKTQYKNGKK